MEVTRIRALRGPNLWSHHTAIQSVVSCAEQDIDNLPGFETRLRARFPEISPFQPIGHKDAVPMARVLELAALGLQAQAGCPVTFSCTTPTLEPQIYQVVVEYSEEEVGKLALELAQQLCQAALNDTPFDLPAALAQLQELDEDVRLGPSTGSIVDAAVARGIPYSRMTEGSMVRLGWGSKQRRIQAAEMDATSAIAEAIAQDKELTKKLLAAAGVPDVKEQLLKGMKVGDKTFKVHLDGYNLTDSLAGKSPDPRHEFFYFNDSGSLAALRYDQWKIVFAEQRAHGFDALREPYVTLNFPKLFNLRSDPFEKADQVAFDYGHWSMDHVFVLVPAQQYIGKFLGTFREFPPSQKVGSFSLDQVMEMLTKGAGDK